MKVTLSVGPGPYSQDLINQLGAHGVLDRVLYSWPTASLHRWNPEKRRLEMDRSLPLYPFLVRAIWAAWTRLPGVGRHRTPQVLIDRAFDTWAATHIGRPDVFVGWSQISLRSLRTARARGIAAVLEHPILHAALWQELMAEEYARYSPAAASTPSLWPAAMTRRMTAEYELADAIVVPSSAAVRSFEERGVTSRKLLRIPFGVSADDFTPADSPDRGGPVRFLFVGRVELLKGVHYLLEAFAALPRSAAELWLVGPVLPEMEDILARHAGPAVKVVGGVGRNEVLQYYRRADALVFPSLCDGFGIVMLEAMACGLPVLTTLNTGGPDLIEEGQTGFVVPIRDAKALTERMGWIISHRRDLPEMGRVGRETVAAKFTLAQYGDAAVNAYRTAWERRA